MSHTIEAALKRGELTEEEAFFVLRFAGQLGYRQAIERLTPGNAFRRSCYSIRKWFIHFGGWETPQLSRWDRGEKAWELFQDYGAGRHLVSPTPVSLFGHRVTLFGTWFQFKWRRGYVVVNHHFKRGQFYAYWSRNGTPPRENAKPGERFFFNKRWKVNE